MSSAGDGVQPLCQVKPYNPTKGLVNARHDGPRRAHGTHVPASACAAASGCSGSPRQASRAVMSLRGIGMNAADRGPEAREALMRPMKEKRASGLLDPGRPERGGEPQGTLVPFAPIGLDLDFRGRMQAPGHRARPFVRLRRDKRRKTGGHTGRSAKSGQRKRHLDCSKCLIPKWWAV